MVQELKGNGHKPTYKRFGPCYMFMGIEKNRFLPSVGIKTQTGHRTSVARTANGFQLTSFASTSSTQTKVASLKFLQQPEVQSGQLW